MKKNFIKTINTFLILSFIFGPISVLAVDPTYTTYPNTNTNTGLYNQNPQLMNTVNNLNTNVYNQNAYNNYNPYQTPGNPFLNSAYVQNQINGIVANASSTASSTNNGVAGSIAAQVGGCGAGQVLSNLITGSVSKALGKATQNIAGSLTLVPTSEQGVVGENIKAQTSASVGTVGFGGVLSLPSWDSVAYCIVNSMIGYIADPTILWINTGFDGNPAFLNNPDMFFKQLADEEAASFIQNLAYGLSGGTNVCDVYREAMVRATLAQYGANQPYGYGYQTGGYVNRGLSNGFLGCTFDQNPGQLNSFMQGNFIQGGGWNSWYNVTQTQQGNPYDTLFRTSDALIGTIVASQNSQMRDLNWNSGFLNYTTCTNNPKTNKKDCQTITPGRVIQGQLESTLNLPKQRLAFADKFDQVVTALVNQFINQALGRVLQQNQTGY